MNSSLKLNLTGPQEGVLNDALLDAFPDYDALRLMVRYKLNKNLAAISMRSNLTYIISDLIVQAEAEQWTTDLILAARAHNPDNVKLLSFAQSIGLAPRTPSLSQLELIITTEDGQFHDPGVWIRRLSEIEAQVCRVEIRLVRGRMVYGTGFLLGPGVVMTNYHVVEALIAGEKGKGGRAGKSAKPQDVILRFDYKRLADGRTINKGKEYHLANSNWLIDYSPYSAADFIANTSVEVPQADQLDYALLRLEGEPGNERPGNSPSAPPRGWIEATGDGYDFKPDTAIAIMQHPEGAPVSLAFETDAVVGVNSNNTRVTYRTNTQGGSSGSPCFNINWELVALHHAGDPNFDPQTPADRPKYNKGIPFSAILNLLEHRGLLAELGLGKMTIGRSAAAHGAIPVADGSSPGNKQVGLSNEANAQQFTEQMPHAVAQGFAVQQPQMEAIQPITQRKPGLSLKPWQLIMAIALGSIFLLCACYVMLVSLQPPSP